LRRVTARPFTLGRAPKSACFCLVFLPRKGAFPKRRDPPRLSTPFTEALSQLNDRALRRLLGARAFLRGYDYVRRNAVSDVVMEELSARGHVRGTDPEPYDVKLQVTPTGFVSECSCPAFPKINGHCKHVAALLIALRDQVRPKQPRPDPPPSAGLAATGYAHSSNGASRAPITLRHRGATATAARLGTLASWSPTSDGSPARLVSLAPRLTQGLDGRPEQGFCTVREGCVSRTRL